MAVIIDLLSLIIIQLKAIDQSISIDFRKLKIQVTLLYI